MSSGKIWTPSHSKVLLLLAKGEMVKDAAVKAGVSTKFVTRMRQRPDFVERLQKLQAEVDSQVAVQGAADIVNGLAFKEAARRELERAAHQAAKTITNILLADPKVSKTTDMRLKFEAAKDVLDRVGLKPRDIVETIERNYKPEEINSAMATMKELATMGQNTFVFGGRAGAAGKLSQPRETETPATSEKSTIDIDSQTGDSAGEAAQPTISN